MFRFPSINWRTIPIVRLTLSFIIGVVLMEYWGGWTQLWSAKLATLLLVFLFAGFGIRSVARRVSTYLGGVILLLFALLGYTRTLQYQQLRQPTHFSQQENFATDSTYFWSGHISDIKAGAERWRLIIDIKDMSMEQSQSLGAVDGRLQLYLPADEQTGSLLPGQQITFSGAVRQIDPPKNPAAFDAAQYYARQNVYHRCWLKEGHWTITDTAPSIYGRAYQFRERLLGILRAYLPANSNELAVSAALILGKRDELSTDLRNAYAETGAVHVLAVSGLHLMFVTLGLGYLLFWIPRGKIWGRWLYFFLVVAGTWAFAFVTGLAPSVMRAAVMLTALELGQAINRKSSTYNALALSAFLLLFYDPYLLFNIGFQLSYLAVLGIVFFQDRIYRAIYFANPILDKTWSLTTVAIAAQLTTLPLSLYYFHQFPLYFLLTGIFVVLLAQFVLGFGIALFLAATILPALATIFSELLYWSLVVMNGIVNLVRALPGHLIQGIWISEMLLLLLSCSVLCLAFFMAERHKPWLWLTMSLVLCTAFGYSWQQISQGQQRQLVVYHQYKGSVIDAFDGRARMTISNLTEGDERLQWSVAPYRQKCRTVFSAGTNHWLELAPVYAFYDLRLAVIDTDFEASTVPEQALEVDLLILRESPRKSLQELQQYFTPKYWIIDGSNYPSAAQRWLEEAKELDIEAIHYTSRDGAFIHQF